MFTEAADAVKPGDKVRLTIGLTGYQISKGQFTTLGHVSVTGDEITFSRADECMEGSGRYRWSIAGGVLRFRPIGANDPCARASTLAGHEYRREAD